MTPTYIIIKVSEEGETTDSVLLRRYAQSCYLMGRFYVSADSTKQAEDLLRRATVLADRAKDYRTTYLAYHYLSRQLIWSNQQEALNLSLKALDYCLLYKDKPENEIAVRINVGTNYALCGDTVNAFLMLDTAYQVALDNQLPIQQNEVVRSRGGVYFAVEDYNKALQLVKKGIANINPNCEIDIKLQLAACYLYCDSMQQAKNLLLSLTNIKDEVDKLTIFQNLSYIAFTENDYTQAMNYYDSVYSVYDQLYVKTQQTKDAYYHDVIIKEKQTEQLKYERLLQKGRTRTAIVIAILLLIAIIGLTLFMRNRIKLLSLQRLNELRTHRREIEQKAHKIDIMQEQLFNQSPVITKIRKGCTAQDMGEEDWLALQQDLDSVFNGVVSRLQHHEPHLSQEQMELCMLNRVGLSRKEIAHFYHVTADAVKVRNRKLKRDVFGISDSSISILQILEELS